MVKTEVIRLRTTPELKAAITKIADEHGCSLSSYIEMLIQDEIDADTRRRFLANQISKNT